MYKKLFKGLCICISIIVATSFLNTTSLNAAEVEYTNRTFQLDAKVFDYGQNIVSLRFNNESEVDETTLDLDTFEVVASGSDPIDVSELDPTNVSYGAFSNVTREIVGVRLDENDSSVIIIDLKVGQSVVGANTLTYVAPSGRNLELVLDYKLTQLKDYSLSDNTIVKSNSTYTMGEVVDPEVAAFEGKTASNGINYQMFTPQVTSERQPLVIWFHGNGEGGVEGYQNNKSQLLANRGALALSEAKNQEYLDNAYVVAPQAPDTWYNNYSKEYLMKLNELIDEVVKNNPNIDVNRIYITGASAGGYMTWHMAVQNPTKFAAIVPICAAIDVAPLRGGEETTSSQIESLKGLPIWLIHSKDDSVVSVDNSSRFAYDILKDDGAIYTEFENVNVDGLSYSGHAAWVYFARNIPTYEGISVMQWLGSQARTMNTLQATTKERVIEGFDWGAATTKIVYELNDEIASINKNMLLLNEAKQNYLGVIETNEKEITDAYVSDEFGNKVIGSSKYITVLPIVHPDSGTSPFTFLLSTFLNIYSNPYDLKITLRSGHEIDGQAITYQALESDNLVEKVSKPLSDQFTTGTHTSENITLHYGSYAPKSDDHKNPLIIWLHGAGEGGTNPELVALGNRVTKLIDSEIQGIMDGAYVLTPQTQTIWMDDGSGNYTTDGKSMYTKTLMNLIKEYVSANPDIDPDRIYIGGCSNGGFMTMNMLINYPDYFAAAFPICEAYADAWISDDMINQIKDIPMWFTQSKDDTTVTYEDNIGATYKRLLAASAKDVFLSEYDHVVDTSGLYKDNMGNPYMYNGHWSWIYALNNECVNGGETLFAWMAKQTKATPGYSKPSTGTGSISTGDNTTITLYGVLLIGGGVVIITSLRRRKKIIHQ